LSRFWRSEMRDEEPFLAACRNCGFWPMAMNIRKPTLAGRHDVRLREMWIPRGASVLSRYAIKGSRILPYLVAGASHLTERNGKTIWQTIEQSTARFQLNGAV